MDDTTALHTAARRYCQERFSDWFQAYKDLQTKGKWQVENLFKPGWDYSEEAYRIFPRYRVARGIQVEVERLTPDPEASFEELRSRLIGACDAAENHLYQELKNALAREALRGEADDFRVYIRVLNPSDIQNVEPLPYRRVINEAESKHLWNRLEQVWAIRGGPWFPLKEGPIPQNVIAFHEDYFAKINGVELLREALQSRGVGKVFQLQEFGPPEPEYEIDLSIFVPAYGSGGEQYSTSGLGDWLVYASHESSITFCGDWLTRILEEKFPDCRQHTYKGPYSTDDLRGTWNSK